MRRVQRHTYSNVSFKALNAACDATSRLACRTDDFYRDLTKWVGSPLETVRSGRIQTCGSATAANSRAGPDIPGRCLRNGQNSPTSRRINRDRPVVWRRQRYGRRREYRRWNIWAVQLPADILVLSDWHWLGRISSSVDIACQRATCCIACAETRARHRDAHICRDECSREHRHRNGKPWVGWCQCARIDARTAVSFLISDLQCDTGSFGWSCNPCRRAPQGRDRRRYISDTAC